MEEHSRTILSDGTVIKFMLDNSVSVSVHHVIDCVIHDFWKTFTSVTYLHDGLRLSSTLSCYTTKRKKDVDRKAVLKIFL